MTTVIYDSKSFSDPSSDVKTQRDRAKNNECVKRSRNKKKQEKIMLIQQISKVEEAYTLKTKKIKKMEEHKILMIEYIKTYINDTSFTAEQQASLLMHINQYRKKSKGKPQNCQQQFPKMNIQQVDKSNNLDDYFQDFTKMLAKKSESTEQRPPPLQFKRDPPQICFTKESSLQPVDSVETNSFVFNVPDLIISEPICKPKNPVQQQPVEPRSMQDEMNEPLLDMDLDIFFAIESEITLDNFTSVAAEDENSIIDSIAENLKNSVNFKDDLPPSLQTPLTPLAPNSNQNDGCEFVGNGIVGNSLFNQPNSEFYGFDGGNVGGITNYSTHMTVANSNHYSNPYNGQNQQITEFAGFSEFQNNSKFIINDSSQGQYGQSPQIIGCSVDVLIEATNTQNHLTNVPSPYYDKNQQTSTFNVGFAEYSNNFPAAPNSFYAQTSHQTVGLSGGGGGGCFTEYPNNYYSNTPSPYYSQNQQTPGFVSSGPNASCQSPQNGGHFGLLNSPPALFRAEENLMYGQNGSDMSRIDTFENTVQQFDIYS